MYQHVAKWTLENVVDRSPETGLAERGAIVFDACAERELYAYLQRRLREHVTARWGSTPRVLVTSADSHDELLLQLADMVCGAVAGAVRNDARAGEYLRLLHRQRGSRRVWP